MQSPFHTTCRHGFAAKNLWLCLAKCLQHHIWLNVLRVIVLVLMVLQRWYFQITQPRDRLMACHKLFLVRIPLCRRLFPDGEWLMWRMWPWFGSVNSTALSLDLARFDCFGRSFLGGFGGIESFINGCETRAAVLNECIWFLWPKWVCLCVPSSGLAH